MIGYWLFGREITVIKKSTGFTLIELGIAIFVMALLLGSLLVPLATQVDQRQISETQKSLEEIKDALVGFAMRNGYLPCPDKFSSGGDGTANDGAEDVTAATGVCVVTDGNVPWQTLGTAVSDAWGNRIRYVVTSAFARRSPASTFTLSSTGGLTVNCPTPGCSSSFNYTTNAPAVILSHGKNGWGAINSSSGSANTAPTSTDELENTNGNTTFVSRVHTQVGTTSGEYDDIVSWLSTSILMNRMVAAGKLP